VQWTSSVQQHAVAEKTFGIKGGAFFMFCMRNFKVCSNFNNNSMVILVIMTLYNSELTQNMIMMMITIRIDESKEKIKKLCLLLCYALFIASEPVFM
jgi:hypothetical protein